MTLYAIDIQNNPNLVIKALWLRKLGNDLITFLGGRESHLVNARVGGFYRVTTKKALSTFIDELKWGTDAATEMTRFTGTLDFPDF